METGRSTGTSIMRKNEAWKITAVANARKYRTVIEMRDKLQLSWREIAGRMHFTESYTRRIYARANMLLGTEKEPERLNNPMKTYETRAKIAAAAEPLIRREDMAMIRSRLKLEKYRTVLYLKEVKNFTYTKIGEEMGYTRQYIRYLYKGAVKARLENPWLFA